MRSLPRSAPLGAPLLLLGLAIIPAAAQVPDYLDPSLPFARRAADLVSRMTLDEKVQQMKNTAPAIPRLGVPAYDWWNEALHGVARSGLATSFPQAIGLAATWDDSLMFRVATAISDEARVKYRQYVLEGQHGGYQGLTFWSPNINLFRDPRWGRGQETYGEDPFLTGRLAVQFIHGMQGDDPKYLKTVATVKHFAVHSGPEPDRHTFDAVVSERDLRETYLPQFRAGIVEGGAWSLMCAYNRVYGKGACGSDLLLTRILRGEWGFPGYVVSDCGAIADLFQRHKVVRTAEEAAALGVRSGTDLNCGDVYPRLATAVRQGLIREREVDTAVTRLFLARMKLGMFDPPDSVPWSRLDAATLDSPAHRELARQAAREAIVLLQNRGNALPLRKDLGTIAVIGPNADAPAVLLGNYHGAPSDTVTPLRGIREAVSSRTTVLFARGSNIADGAPAPDTIPPATLADSALAVARRADAVILVLGLSNRLEGEEMRVQVDGFAGGDRTSLDLPAAQERLLEAVASVGKPTILVLLNGSALAVRWAREHIPAIVEAWYPGQAGGTALADVLFGDYNPAGRLPVTFYQRVEDLPPFTDYDMKGRTYRYFDGPVLFPFGHGLSYTTFAYDSLRFDRDSLAQGDTLAVSVVVSNIGNRAGEEVPQLYVQHPDSRVTRPRLDLRGYQRIALAPGERRTVVFRVPATALAWWNPDEHRWRLERETVRFAVGASSADLRLDGSVLVAGDAANHPPAP
jgi:beta-glucosidase